MNYFNFRSFFAADFLEIFVKSFLLLGIRKFSPTLKHCNRKRVKENRWKGRERAGL